MKLLGARVRSFGKLKDIELEFGPGLNVIFAPNESGKSTLLAFIGASLYGFVKPDAKTRTLDEDYERYRPWQGQDYGGRIEYALESGDRFELARDFAGHSVKIFDSNGTDITTSFESDRTRERLIAEAHLGLDKRAFISTILIDHASSGVLRNQSGIIQRLQSYVATGEPVENSSASKALEILNSAKGRIGERESASTKLFGQASARLRVLSDELAEVSGKHQELAAHLDKVQSLREDIAGLRVRLEKSETASKSRQLRDLSGAVDMLDDIDHNRSLALGELAAIGQVPEKTRESIRLMEAAMGNPVEGVAQSLLRESSQEDLSAVREIIERDLAEYGKQSDASAASRNLGGMFSLMAIVSAVAGIFGLTWAFAPGLVFALLAGILFRMSTDRGKAAAAAKSGAEARRDQIAERESAGRESEKKLQAMLSKLGVPDVESLKSLSGLCRSAQRIEDRLNDLAERRRSLLAGRNEQELRESHALLQVELGMGSDDGQSEGVMDALDSSTELREAISSREMEIVRLEAEVSGTLKGCRNPGDIESDIEEATRELEDVIEKRDAIDMAIKLVSDCSRDVHEHYASELSRILNESVYSATGTYNEVRFDENLGMNVRIPGIDEWRPVDNLSWGTKEQFYVLFKAALARVMSKSGEPLPILLDDVFAHSDDGRLPRLAQFLLELSRDHQVILLTCRESQVAALRCAADSAGVGVDTTISGSFTSIKCGYS